jgi:hypothetical protein
MRLIMRVFFALILLGVLVSCNKSEPEQPRSTATPDSVEAVVAVERAAVFPIPDRNAAPLTYVYQREQFAVRGRSEDSSFVLVTVEGVDGWLLSAQMTISGDLARVAVVTASAALVTPVLSPTVSLESTLTPVPITPEFTPQPSHTPLATRTPLPTLTPTVPGGQAEIPIVNATTDPNAIPTSPALKVGAPPPLTITLPEGWRAGHVLVPFRTYDSTRDVPLSIYSGPLPNGVTGYIYLFWGFPNVASPTTGEINLWADGLQLLRGALVDQSCNLGIDRNQQDFYVGGIKAVGTFYQAISCEGETDTTGWFAALSAYNGNYAFFTAVEPYNTLPDQIMNLQAILNTVVFLPPEETPGQ